jgi:hypothetical protein
VLTETLTCTTPAVNVTGKVGRDVAVGGKVAEGGKDAGGMKVAVADAPDSSRACVGGKVRAPGASVAGVASGALQAKTGKRTDQTIRRTFVRLIELFLPAETICVISGHRAR